ncbi:unnamed protein product, partial [Pocillopora meandrina]
VTNDSSPENLKTVVTIPENLLLSDSEKSVLSKGLNFVPISQKTDEFSVKQDVEKFLRRVQLKAFFHDKEDDSNTSNKDTFKTLQNLTLINQNIVKNTINDLIAKQELPATAKNLIITTPRTSCIYFLPKIHKPNNPGRPIVSACSCPTEVISSYLDKIKAPIVKTLPSYIKDSQHALEIFRDFSFLDQNKLIFTMDITFLYTVIPNDEGLRAHKHVFDLRTVKEPSSETLLRLAELLTQFITAVNSFHPALKYTWEISDTSLAFLDI